MKKILLLSTITLLLSSFIFNTSSISPKEQDPFCISKEDLKLHNLINEYRKSKSLPNVPLSKSLCKVAITHTLDLKLNRPDKAPCNLHSWSKGSTWEGCCYKGGKEGSCMWSKPSELTNYKSDGYEIAAFFSDKMTAEKALELWKSSPGHNSVICNLGMWKAMDWGAMGVSVYGNYAVVWFGVPNDPDGKPAVCQ
ncbi:MAG: CAP domain-containing protein [Bacteroidetes bacterium]|nr:CAP domain-containing protein [Bacteroidota bacterium]